MEQTTLILTILYWISLGISTIIGFIYFRDLGDASQIFFDVKRKNILKLIRIEYKLIIPGLLCGVLATALYFSIGVGEPISFWIITSANVIFYAWTWIWVHVGLKHKRENAKFYSIIEAKKYVAPDDSVIVIENNGHARAHPDYELWRPHLAGNDEGLGGEDVIMTYCSMTHLGHAYKPEIDGKKLKLEVLAQHGNNLIMRDNTTNEPIQQVYGYREKDGKEGSKMPEWPTFRMSFRGFEKAYPNGEVFLNKPTRNIFKRAVDYVVNSLFLIGLANQYRREEPYMNNVEHIDDRLPLKSFVWGFNVGNDYTCYTEDFVKLQKAPINVNVGGRDIVAAYDGDYESLGIYYNDSGNIIKKVDFFGESDHGKLNRVETVKAGSFWHVWANFFPDTDFNRTSETVSPT